MADAQHLPQGRRQAGDRNLKFHETRDNLVNTCRCELAMGLAGDVRLRHRRTRRLLRPWAVRRAM